MGKKSRRKAKLRAAARMAQKAQQQPAYQPQPLAAQVAEPVAETKPAPVIQQAVLPSQANRYQYVPAEMRQIAIIAGALFVILFVLAFVLH